MARVPYLQRYSLGWLVVGGTLRAPLSFLSLFASIRDSSSWNRRERQVAWDLYWKLAECRADLAFIEARVFGNMCRSFLPRSLCSRNFLGRRQDIFEKCRCSVWKRNALCSFIIYFCKLYTRQILARSNYYLSGKKKFWNMLLVYSGKLIIRCSDCNFEAGTRTFDVPPKRSSPLYVADRCYTFRH